MRISYIFEFNLKIDNWYFIRFKTYIIVILMFRYSNSTAKIYAQNGDFMQNVMVGLYKCDFRSLAQAVADTMTPIYSGIYQVYKYNLLY